MSKLATIIFLCFIVVGCNNTNVDTAELIYDYEESWFSDFGLKDGKVYFDCYITVINKSDKSVNFTMEGEFFEDYESDLVSSQYLIGCKTGNLEKDEFFIASNKSVEYLVTFVGINGCNVLKSNRLPPREVKLNLKNY